MSAYTLSPILVVPGCTTGFNVETIKSNGVSITAWDVGGGPMVVEQACQSLIINHQLMCAQPAGLVVHVRVAAAGVPACHTMPPATL